MAQFDLILFGATGFTGRLAAEYLAKRAALEKPPVKWALAGRSVGALEAVRSSLGDACSSVPLVIADSHDAAQLDALVAQTRVVLTTVGPYAQHGELLLAACARRGVHYADITGEFPWVHDMIARYDAVARASGAKVLTCCGFDCLPSELGVAACSRALAAVSPTGDPTMARVTGLVGPLRGGVSGGTAHTMLGLMAQPWGALLRTMRAAASPFYLVPQDAARPPPPPAAEYRGVWYDATAGRLTAPWLMATGNRHIVHRGNALQQWRYGKHFTYTEALAFPASPAGLLAAVSAALLPLFFLTAVLGVVRQLLARYVLPAPGTGPSAAQRAKGFVDMHFYASNAAGQRAHVLYHGNGDPGYAGTAAMLVECGFSLLRDRAPAAAPTGGVLTPLAALGAPLEARLAAAGFTTTVISD